MKQILLKILIFIGQRFFFVRGKVRKILLGIINSIINYQTLDDPINSRVLTSVNGVPFYFYFDGMSEVKQIFGNYNKKEINFLKNCMNENSVFIDIGSNIGFYSQNIASIFPKIKFSKIISIEPNQTLIKRHNDNIFLLSKKIKGIEKKIYLENCAVGPTNKKTFLNLNEGYGNARIVENSGEETIHVIMKPLIEILKEKNVDFITCLKIDIEGFEDRALTPFFESAPKNLYPQHIVLEYTSQAEWKNKNLIRFFYDLGYVEKLKTRANMCLSLKSQ